MPKDEKTKLKMCVIINPAFALSVLHDQIRFWIEHGLEVCLISSPGPDHEVVRRSGALSCQIKMERYPSPFKDLISLLRIWWFFLWHRFDIIHISTPKASFLGAIAVRLSGQRNIFYLVRGKPYTHMTGLKRKIMNVCEGLICRLAKVVVPVSAELGRDLVENGLCPPKKIVVIGRGSSAGVDLEKFIKNEETIKKGRELRNHLKIDDRCVVILFVGWLRKEKGINELVYTFKGLQERYSNIHLLLLGDYELSDSLEPVVLEMIETHKRIHKIGWQQNPVGVYAAADIFVLPSYREGFPRVLLEASAMELPVVATDIIGCREAVDNGVTGLLVKFLDEKDMQQAIERLIRDTDIRRQMGVNGRRWVEQYYDQYKLWNAHLDRYVEMTR